MRKLYRSRKNSVIAGVCGGIGNYLNIDPVVVRILFVIGLFTVGFGILAYIIAILIMPLEPADGYNYGFDDGTQGGYQPAPTTSTHTTRIVIGLFLILIGALTVLQRLFRWFDFNLFWPVAIIALGLVILFQGSRRS